MEFTTETQREPLAPLTTRFKVVRCEDDGSLLLTVLGFGEETGTFRLHPDGTLEHVLDLAPVGRCHQGNSFLGFSVTLTRGTIKTEA